MRNIDDLTVDKANAAIKPRPPVFASDDSDATSSNYMSLAGAGIASRRTSFNEWTILDSLVLKQ